MSNPAPRGPRGPHPRTTATIRPARRTAGVSAALAVGLVLAVTAGLTAPIPSPAAAPTTTVPAAPVTPVAPSAAASAPVRPAEAGGQGAVVFDGEAGGLAGLSASANASVVAGAAKTGDGGLQLASTEAAAYARWGTDVVPQGETHAVTRQWVRVLSRGAGQSVDVFTVGNALQTANFDFFVNGVNQRFQWDIWREDTDQTDFAVEYGRWYLVEAQVEFSGTQHTATVRIDGVDQGTIASTGTSTTVRMLTLGTTVAKTHAQDYDDIAMQVDDGPMGWLADTPPSVAVTRPLDGATYVRGQSVTADFACAHGDHTVVSCTGPVVDGEAIDTATLGSRTFTVTATDRAGYTASRTHSYTVVDGTDPTVTVTTPAAAATYPQGADVPADYACVDEAGGSGLALSGGCVGPVAVGAAIDTSTLGAHGFAVTATDQAGNTSTVTRTYTVADAGEPEVELASPVDGTTYTRGAVVTAAFTCADDPGGSGLAPTDGCVGPVLPGERIDTMALGEQQFSVTATDNAGNTTTVKGTYTVVRNRPDAHIRRAIAARFAGDGVYSPNGAGQTRAARVGPGGQAVFFVRVQNDGEVVNGFRVRGPRSDMRWTVRYFAGTRDVTAAVTAGTYRVDDLAPGGTRILRVVVRPTPRADRGDRHDVTVRLSARTQPGVADTVRAVVRRA